MAALTGPRRFNVNITQSSINKNQETENRKNGKGWAKDLLMRQ
jgi:hypothetical protein